MDLKDVPKKLVPTFEKKVVVRGGAAKFVPSFEKNVPTFEKKSARRSKFVPSFAKKW